MDAPESVSDELRDPHVTLSKLKAKVQSFASERDWLQFHSPKNLSMALAAEAGELMELFLWKDSNESRAFARNPAKRSEICDELADIAIYTLEFANVAGIDLASAIEAKMRKNARKYPVEKARGRSDKYTDL